MSMGLGLLTGSFPYWPTTSTPVPSGLVTALIVSAVATPPGIRRTLTIRGCVGRCTSMTAIPGPLVAAVGTLLTTGGLKRPADDPDTYAQSPAQAMLAFALGRESRPSAVLSSAVKPTSSSPQL